MKYTAKALMDLLAARHANDVFVPECKDGPTHTSRHIRMDAWVMPRSWSRPWVSAYEVKVTRADFLQDNKWPAYLDLCNAFSFVTPPKLIDPAELPDGVGLIECTRNATRLLTRRKAAHRDVVIPESVWRYVLMCRARIVQPNHTTRSRQEFWTEWLRERETDRTLGWEVGGKIRQLYEENVERVEKENNRLASENEGLAEVKRILDEMGITSVNTWRTEQLIRDRIAESRSGMTRELRKSLEAAGERISKLLAELPDDEKATDR